MTPELEQALWSILGIAWFALCIVPVGVIGAKAVGDRNGRGLGIAIGLSVPALLGVAAVVFFPDGNPFARPFTLVLMFASLSGAGVMLWQFWSHPEWFKPSPEPVPEMLLPEELTQSSSPQSLPDRKRTEHMMIVAGSGSGKTQLLQTLLLKDLDEDATIIVIDSQSSLINNLLNVVPVDRLVHITPTDRGYPLALNLFEKGQDSSLYEYIFQAFGGELTPQMATVFRYVARLVASIPQGNINTMRIILEKNGLTLYQSYIPTLPPIVRAFFETQYETDRSVLESRQAVLRRLYAALENETFAAMFSAPQTKLDIAQAMNDKKVILIDTAKGTLTGDTFKIFGRFFLAQIAKAMFNRTNPYPYRVYLYIDEFQEYAGEEGFVTELFTQARKWNVGIIVAFQYLAQMPEQVLKAVMSNTALKFVGKVSAADEKAMAAELRVKAVDVWQRKGRFHINFRNTVNGADYWDVEFGRLEAMNKRSLDELENIRYRMREAYSWKPQPYQPEPTSDPDDVAETGKW